MFVYYHYCTILLISFVITLEWIPTPSDPVYKELNPVWSQAPSSHLLVLHQTTHRCYVQGFHGPFFQKWVARSFFTVCVSLGAPLKPVHHGWPCWYLKYQWHAFQHHSNTQPLHYDNWQVGGVVPWQVNEIDPLRWECWVLTIRPPGLAILFVTSIKMLIH